MNIVSLNLNDLAGLSYNLCTAINELTDHQAVNLSLKDTWLSYPAMILGKEAYKEAPKLIKNADVIHVNEYFGLFKRIKVDPLSCKDKQIIFHGHGGRFRRNIGSTLEFLHKNFPQVKVIVSTPDFLRTLFKIHVGAMWFPSIVPIRQYHEYETQKNHPPIVYNSATKPFRSFPMLQKVIRDLQMKGVAVEMKANSGIPHKNNLRQKSKADIYFDGLRLFYGVNAIEAAAFEIPVICGINKWIQRYFLRKKFKCKFKYFDMGDYSGMRDEMEKLIIDEDYRKNVGRECFEYVKDVHSREVCVKRFLELIE